MCFHLLYDIWDFRGVAATVWNGNSKRQKRRIRPAIFPIVRLYRDSPASASRNMASKDPLFSLLPTPLLTTLASAFSAAARW
jgi:hypothetical protein